MAKSLKKIDKDKWQHMMQQSSAMGGIYSSDYILNLIKKAKDIKCNLLGVKMDESKVNESVHSLNPDYLVDNKLKPGYSNTDGEACVIFGKPFKVSDAAGRAKAINFAKKCGYQLARDAYEWEQFAEDAPKNMLVCVCSFATMNPDGCYFFEFGGDGIRPIMSV